ncbi:MAG: class I SAM-dependent methyltransferase [Anaerolineae bacterium]
MTKLKPGIQVTQKRGLYYLVDSKGRMKRSRPWLGDSFAFLYDFAMRKSVFPRKFGAEIGKHYDILTQALADVHGQHMLELATGSGSAVRFLTRDNAYTGTDISPNLLRRAAKRFSEAGFREPTLYVVSAEDIPFANAAFDLVLCILSLNFFSDVDQVFQEVRRVLAPGGMLICSVPVPERQPLQSRIRGTLYSEADWGDICAAHGMAFQPIPGENGALLYFKALKQA